MSRIDYHKKKFLIIEDHAEFRSSVKAIIRLLGANMIDTANNGDEGISKIINNQYDIILSDYELGKGKDGQQVLEETRHSGLLKASSVFILVTAATTVEMVMGALEYEPDGYITKPITHDNLHLRLDKIILEKEIFKKIDTAIDNKKYKTAINECDNIAKNQPKYKIKALRIKSKLLLKLEYYVEAEKLFEEVIKIRDIPWARLGLGKIAYFNNNLDSALEIFSGLAKEDTRNVEAYDWISKINLSQNNPAAAQEALQHAIKRSPKSILRQMELANIAKTNEDWPISEVAFRKSVNLGKDSCYKSPHNYTSLVQVLQHTLKNASGRKLKDASNEASRILGSLEKEYSGNNEVQLFSKVLHAEMESNLGKVEDAKRMLEKIQEDIKILPGQLPEDMAMSLANIYEATGNNEESKKLRDKYKNTPVSEILNNDGVRYFKSGNIKEALSVFSEAAREPDASTSVLLNVVQALIKTIEQEGANEQLVESCGRYFSRMENMNSEDKNYPRYKKLFSIYQSVSSSSH